MDEVRARYLRDKVLTATPAQRIVLLYDRLGLDLALADTEDRSVRGTQVAHAMQVVAELRSSLDVTAGGAAENLAGIYAFLLGEMVAIQGGDSGRLAPVQEIVRSLRESWAQASAELAGPEQTVGTAPAAARGSWVG